MNRRFNELTFRAKSAFRHYPFSFIFALLACVFQCYWFKTGTVKTIFGQQPLLLSGLAILGFFISLSATLFADSQRETEDRKWKLFGGLFTAATLLACYIRLAELQTIGTAIYLSWQFLLLLAAVGLTVFFAGVIHRERDFRVHVITMAVNILISYLYAFVVFLGISLLLAGADLLFGLVVFSDALFYVVSVCFLPLMALFFLARIGDGNREKHKGVLSLVDNVFGNILVPVLSAYVALLYLYIVKIIALRELPTTSVVNLILWPLALGVLVLFVVDHDREHTAIYYFRKIHAAGINSPFGTYVLRMVSAGEPIWHDGKPLHGLLHRAMAYLRHDSLYGGEAGDAYGTPHDADADFSRCRLRRTHRGAKCLLPLSKGEARRSSP